MECVDINGTEYKFIVGTGDDDKFRNSFNELTEKTFGFNFEQWYQDGYWKKQYLPYSLMHEDKVVANVSVNIMDFDVNGETKRYIQLGTVMTDVSYRNKGLIRMIIGIVIEEWQDKGDLIFLLANDSVLNFYPKFGFTKLNQYQCAKIIDKRNNDGIVKKLHVSDKEDRTIMYEKANVLSSYAKISMCGNAELIMFYCTSFMKDNIYYIEDYDAVVIAEYNQDTIEVLDVFCQEEVPLDSILNCMVKDNTKSVKLGFTPKETNSYRFTPIEEEDTLFVLGNDTLLLSEQRFMFPVLSHT